MRDLRIQLELLLELPDNLDVSMLRGRREFVCAKLSLWNELELQQCWFKHDICTCKYIITVCR